MKKATKLRWRGDGQNYECISGGIRLAVYVVTSEIWVGTACFGDVGMSIRLLPRISATSANEAKVLIVEALLEWLACNAATFGTLPRGKKQNAVS